MLLYDGLHYDAMALQSSPGASEATDITLLPVNGQLAGTSLPHMQPLSPTGTRTTHTGSWS
jgi:hypothetical protein